MQFILIYIIFLFMGLYLGFSYKAMAVWIAGAFISSVAKFVFHNTVIANTTAYLVAAVTLYLIATRETS